MYTYVYKIALKKTKLACQWDKTLEKEFKISVEI